MNLVRKTVGQVGGTLYGLHHRIERVGARNEIQQALQQICREILNGFFLAFFDQPLHDPVDAAKQLFDVRIGGEFPVDERHHQCFGGIHQAAQPQSAGDGIDLLQHVQHFVQPLVQVVFPVPEQQPLVITVAQSSDDLGNLFVARTRHHGFTFHQAIKIRGIKYDFRCRMQIPQRPEIVQHRQQYQGNVRLTFFQPLQVRR